MVIVEGCDGSGKTTLIRRLCKELEVDIMPRACTSDKGPIDNLRAWVERDLQSGMQPGSGLYDRHPLISELIYGPLVRGQLPDDFDQWWLTAMLAKLDRLEPLIIFCIPPWPAVESNVEHTHGTTTPHLRGVLRNLRKIYDLYRVRAAVNFSLTPDNRTRTLVWDYTDPGRSDFDLLLEWARPKVLSL